MTVKCPLEPPVFAGMIGIILFRFGKAKAKDADEGDDQDNSGDKGESYDYLLVRI